MPKAFHRQREFFIKPNGLPQGLGLFWQDKEHKYIYAKLHGEKFACKTSDWREAVDFLEAKRKEWNDRENGLVFADVLVKTLLDDLIVYYQDLAKNRGKYAPKTAYIAGSQINMKDGVRETFGDLKVSKITPPMYADYRRKWVLKYEKAGKPGNKTQYTIDHHLAYLKRAIKLGQENGNVGPNIPLPNIDKANATRNQRKGLIREHTLNDLLATLPDWLVPVIVLCNETGTRRKEATFIHRSECNFDERLVHLRAEETKPGKEKTFGMSELNWPIVMAWEERTRREFPKAEYLFHRNGVQLHEVNDIENEFNKACELLGIHKPVLDEAGNPVRLKNGVIKIDRKAIGWHDTRRTAATTLADLAGINGVNDTDINRSVGMSPETRERYDQSKHYLKIQGAMDIRDGAVVVVPPPVAIVPTDWKSELKELKSMLDEEILTPAEFELEKARVMSSRKI